MFLLNYSTFYLNKKKSIRKPEFENEKKFTLVVCQHMVNSFGLKEILCDHQLVDRYLYVCGIAQILCPFFFLNLS